MHYQRIMMLCTGEDAGSQTSRELLREVLCNTFPEIKQSSKIAGGSHHDETLDVHLDLTHRHMCDLASNPLLRLAAYLHDVGKVTQSHANNNFHKHETIGAHLVYEWALRTGFPIHEARYLSQITRHHMWYFKPDASEATIRRWLKSVGTPLFSHLLLLRIADRAGNRAKRDEPLKTRAHIILEQKIEAILNAPGPVFYTELRTKEILPDLTGEFAPIKDRILDDIFAYARNKPEDNTEDKILEFYQLHYDMYCEWKEKV